MTIIVTSLSDAALGGALIGASAAGLLLLDGRIAGISGILAQAVRGTPGRWRWGFLLGLILAAPIASHIGAGSLTIVHQAGYPVLVAAGLLVGAGTRWANGCTSGHGVCGIANLSPRSLVATPVFMLFGVLTVFVVRHLLGGAGR